VPGNGVEGGDLVSGVEVFSGWESPLDAGNFAVSSISHQLQKLKGFFTRKSRNSFATAGAAPGRVSSGCTSISAWPANTSGAVGTRSRLMRLDFLLEDLRRRPVEVVTAESLSSYPRPYIFYAVRNRHDAKSTGLKKTSSSLHAIFMFVWYTILAVVQKSPQGWFCDAACSQQNRTRAMMRLIKLIQKMKPVFTGIALLTVLSSCVNASPQDVSLSSQDAAVSPQEVSVSAQDWQEEFNIAARKLTHTGENGYFILKPGFQIILASKNEELIISVLDETKEINGVTTRVVEEREEKNGELYEISTNFFAIDQETGDVFYFGEEVDFYKGGNVVGHSGEWLAYENGNQPGLIMPGAPEVGMKYYQELAPGVAMDRAEVLSISETFNTPAGEFRNCLVTRESSALESARERKTYAPGIGLIQDESLKLVSYGYVEETSPQK